MSKHFNPKHYGHVQLEARDAAEMTAAILEQLELLGSALQNIQHLLLEEQRRKAQ